MEIKTITMVGGCTVRTSLIPTWTLVNEDCVKKGVCVCPGTPSKHLLNGDYEGFGKRFSRKD